MSDLPEIGTKVVHHRTFGAPHIGEVIPTRLWVHKGELTPDSFVVEFDDRTSRFTLDEASATGKTVHIEPRITERDGDE